MIFFLKKKLAFHLMVLIFCIRTNLLAEMIKKKKNGFPFCVLSCRNVKVPWPSDWDSVPSVLDGNVPSLTSVGKLLVKCIFLNRRPLFRNLYSFLKLDSKFEHYSGLWCASAVSNGMDYWTEDQWTEILLHWGARH